ncbi:cytochrome P450 4C1-like [Colias croceus]|uniref:cytochrome P450 4C1-like n=1 Tax=Colias crocea TaxID=72248 RepID=UPI001E27DD42|nr:cytochrome P450 4C1-like [Colias croceus]
MQHAFKGTDVAFHFIKEFTKFCEKSGGIIKFWGGPIFFAGVMRPNDVDFILKKFPEKESREKLLREFTGNAGIYAPVPIWTRRRKIMVPAFSPKIINSFLDTIVAQSENLNERLAKDDRIGTGQFSIWPYVTGFTLSTIAETSLGVNLDIQRNPDIPFLNAINRTLFLMTKRLWPDWLFRLTPSYREAQECKEIMNSLSNKIIQKRREVLKDFKGSSNTNSIYGQGEHQVKSFLDHLIMQSRINKMTDTEIREEILVLLIAGTDTSAVAICNTLKLLAMYPDVQAKVYKEIISILKDDHPLDKNSLRDLDYLQRVIKESLRLFPPVPIIGRKLDTEVKLPSGAILPEGAEVIISIWGIHRDVNNWGSTAECFDPDRFQSKEDGGRFIPFGSGPRNCIGYQYALTGIKIALATILRHYRVVGKEAISPIPTMDLKFSIMLRATDDYQISLERR